MDRFLTDGHRQFQNVFRSYVRDKLVPQREEWDRQRAIPKAVYKDLGAHGFLCPWVEPEYGGPGGNFGHSYVINLELGRAGSPMYVSLHNDMSIPYIGVFGSSDQKRRWLPGCLTGDLLGCVALTEPGAGSDLAGMTTTATRDGDNYIINGHKIFISNGTSCDLAIVACRTGANDSGRHGISMLVVEDGTPGFTKVRKLNKIGQFNQETSELLFTDCRVPTANLIGQEDMGFKYMMSKLQTERLAVAHQCQGMAERALELALDYAKTREAFGQPIGRFQHNQFKLAEVATEVALGKALMDEATEEYLEGKDCIVKVSMAKWWISEMLIRVAYQCQQIYGGYGFLEEYEIARIYRDARMQTLGGGTTEILKWSIAKRLGL